MHTQLNLIFLYIWVDIEISFKGFKMTLNYRVIVNRYPFPNGVVVGSIPTVKSSLYLTGKKLAR